MTRDEANALLRRVEEQVFEGAASFDMCVIWEELGEEVWQLADINREMVQLTLANIEDGIRAADILAKHAQKYGANGRSSVLAADAARTDAGRKRRTVFGAEHVLRVVSEVAGMAWVEGCQAAEKAPDAPWNAAILAGPAVARAHATLLREHFRAPTTDSLILAAARPLSGL